MKRAGRRLAAALPSLLLAVAACERGEERSLVVTATAFNSVEGQTDDRPQEAAWGDQLEPGMKAIAVSRDLIAMGLRHGTHVRIEGLPGRYVVRDKMARRWRKRIDIYMGDDVEAAREWGRRQVRIRWRVPDGAAGDVAAGGAD